MRFVTSKSLMHCTMALAGLSAASVLAVQAVGCSSRDATSGPSTGQGGHPVGQGAGPSEQVGNVGMQVTLPGGAMLNTVSWVITGPSGASTVVQQGTVNLAGSLTVSFLVSGLPAANGYTIALNGTSVDATVTCTGSAQFNVQARATTQVSDLLQCNSAINEAGSAQVNAPTYNCAAWGTVSAMPSEATLGNPMALSATATGANPSGLTYQWSAPSGSLSAPTSANTNFTCNAPGTFTITLTVGDGPVPEGGSCPLSTTTLQVQCDSVGGVGSQTLITTIGAGVVPTIAYINQGTAIGQGSGNGATPSLLSNTAADPNNTQVVTSNDGGAPFFATGTVPDKAAGFCTYPTDGGAPKRVSYVTGSKFETSADAGSVDGGLASDPMLPLAPAYFPLVYNTLNTTTGNAFGGQPPIIGLFDWRPKDIDEALLVAESDDNGKTWFFMQNVLELNPDYTNPISGGYSPTATNTGCPATLQSTNANFAGATGSQADDGWGHATIIQLPGPTKVNQFLYMLDRNTNNIPDAGVSIVDNAPLHVIALSAASNKFPIWNSNSTSAGANDIKSISTALNNTPGAADAGNAITVQNTVGLLNPDGIMAVFPMAASTSAGTAVTVLYVQKILGGDNSGPTALPVAQQCTKAPFSGKTNHDIAYVRLATTVDGVNFLDQGIVQGLSDPTTVDYTKTRWVSPRATLIDIRGDGSLWGMYFAAGNCLDGDSDAFHYIGYAESTDKAHWTVFNDINNPIASINPITTTNQATGTTVTVPANPPLIPTQPWFAERLYAPTATRIDANHLSMTFAGYASQTPDNDLLAYRQIGNVVLTVNVPLPVGVPNNINAH